MRELPKGTVPPPPDDDDDELLSDSRILLRPEEVVLLLKDDVLMQELQRRLVDAGYLPGRGTDVARASVVIVLASSSGVHETVSSLRSRARSDTAVILLTDEASPEAAAQARAAGAFACAHAPFLADEIMALVEAALEVRSARRRVADLSHKLDLEAHLASLGRISAGLSHELGSPLSAALMGVETVQVALEALLRVREELARIVDAAPREREVLLRSSNEYLVASRDSGDARGAIDDTLASLIRARDLLTTMRELVRQRTPSLDSVDLVAVADEVFTTISRAPSFAKVTFEKVFDEVKLPVASDRTRLAQILVNLTSNAAQAAERLPAPRVRVHVYRSKAHAIVSVRDNGPGLERELLEKIFEPFFTTRREEGGTGLGLALCREYAIQIGANLSVWSVPGRGTCFRLRLPTQHCG